MARGRGKLTPKDIETMKIISNNIRSLLTKNDTKQVDLSRSTNIPASTITGYVKGTSLPIPGNIQKIADFFNVPKSAIDPRFETFQQNLSNSEQVKFISIPLYDSISCGTGSFVDDDIIEHVNIPSDSLNGDSSDYFAQRAKGDSMIDAGIHDGDLLVFQKTSFIEDNQIGSFCIDDGIATCKKFKSGKSFIQLIPMNRKYDPIVIDLNDINFRVVGVLKLLIKEFK